MRKSTRCPPGGNPELRTLSDGPRLKPVSYTHLDVYKRQLRTWSLTVDASESAESLYQRWDAAVARSRALTL